MQIGQVLKELQNIASSWCHWVGVVACAKQIHEERYLAAFIFAFLVFARLWDTRSTKPKVKDKGVQAGTKTKQVGTSSNPSITRNAYGLKYSNPVHNESLRNLWDTEFVFHTPRYHKACFKLDPNVDL